MISKVLGAVLLVFFMGVRTLSVGAETRPSVADFLGQVQATYDKMQSYSSVGDVISDISTPNLGQIDSHHTFSMKLARPNLYRVEWELHAPYIDSSGAVWSAGDGNFVVAPGLAGPTRPKDMSTALSMATGLSGGAAATIPAIFFGLSFNALKAGNDAAFKPDSDIEGDACYVIAEKTGTVGVTMWISKKSKLLRQIREDFNGSTKMPEMTDEEARKVLESMGWATTAEAIKDTKAQMTSMRSMMSSGMSGFSIQVQRKIVLNATLHKADFTTHPSPASK